MAGNPRGLVALRQPSGAAGKGGDDDAASDSARSLAGTGATGRNGAVDLFLSSSSSSSCAAAWRMQRSDPQPVKMQTSPDSVPDRDAAPVTFRHQFAHISTRPVAAVLDAGLTSICRVGPLRRREADTGQWVVDTEFHLSGRWRRGERGTRLRLPSTVHGW